MKVLEKSTVQQNGTEEKSVETTTKIKYNQIETTQKFILNAIKSAGFTFEDCISEFIDNSIDAKAKKLIITSKKIDDKFEIRIKDNGRGIPHSKIYDVVRQLGFDNQNYSSDSISNFGLGMKFAIINLSQEGDTKIVSVHKNKKSTIYLNVDHNIGSSVSDPIIEETTELSGTEIIIPNIIATDNRITSLIKHLGTVYFPHVDNGNDLEIVLIQGESEPKIIQFSDPFYRNINPNKVTYENGISSNEDELYINGYKIKITGRFFSDEFNHDNFSSYDIKQGGSGFAGARSGVYFRLNGRYITLGGNDFYVRKNSMSGMNRIRIEVDIDRELISDMGVTFNKSRIILTTVEKVMEPTTKDFVLKLDGMIRWGVTQYTKFLKNDSNINLEDKAERDELNRDINARRRKYPLSDDILDGLNEKKGDNKSKPKKPKSKPSGKTRGKYDKRNVDFRYESLGKDKAFDWYKERGVFVVIYNTNHEFYNYYIKQNQSSKKQIDFMTLSLAESLLLLRNTNLDDYFLDIQTDLIIYMSTRLSKYNKD